MRAIELPAGMIPGSPEAVAFIESQVPRVFNQAEVEQVAPTLSSIGSELALDLIIAGLEQMLDGFKELQNA